MTIIKKQATQIITKETSMKKNKILCTIIVLTLFVSVFSPVTALALTEGDHFFTFSYADAGEHKEPVHQKGDTEQRWVVQLYQSSSSNLSSGNVLSLKMNRVEANTVDRWHTFSNYVDPYGIPYQTIVSETDWMYLSMKRVITSSVAPNLYVTGAYNP